MRIGFESDIAIQAPGGHNQPHIVQFHVRKCRPAGRAKAFAVSRGWQREARDLILPSTHLSVAPDANKLAACADPESLRQYSQ